MFASPAKINLAHSDADKMGEPTRAEQRLIDTLAIPPRNNKHQDVHELLHLLINRTRSTARDRAALIHVILDQLSGLGTSEEVERSRTMFHEVYSGATQSNHYPHVNTLRRIISANPTENMHDGQHSGADCLLTSVRNIIKSLTQHHPVNNDLPAIQARMGTHHGLANPTSQIEPTSDLQTHTEVIHLLEQAYILASEFLAQHSSPEQDHEFLCDVLQLMTHEYMVLGLMYHPWFELLHRCSSHINHPGWRIILSSTHFNKLDQLNSQLNDSIRQLQKMKAAHQELLANLGQGPANDNIPGQVEASLQAIQQKTNKHKKCHAEFVSKFCHMVYALLSALQQLSDCPLERQRLVLWPHRLMQIALELYFCYDGVQTSESDDRMILFLIDQLWRELHQLTLKKYKHIQIPQDIARTTYYLQGFTNFSQQRQVAEYILDNLHGYTQTPNCSAFGCIDINTLSDEQHQLLMQFHQVMWLVARMPDIDLNFLLRYYTVMVMASMKDLIPDPALQQAVAFAHTLFSKPGYQQCFQDILKQRFGDDDELLNVMKILFSFDRGFEMLDELESFIKSCYYVKTEFDFFPREPGIFYDKHHQPIVPADYLEEEEKASLSRSYGQAVG